MPTDDVLYLDAASGAPAYDAGSLRRANAIGKWPTADKFGARSGVRPGGVDSLTLSGTIVTVQHTVATLYVSGSTLRGPYDVALQSKTHTVPAAAASTRVDLVVLEVKDHTEDASGLRQADTVYVTGTPGGGTPGTPPGTMLMGTISVPPLPGSPSLSYSALWTVACGGILPVRTSGERPTTGLYPGMAIWQQDIKAMLITDAATPTPNWIEIGREVVATSAGVIDVANWGLVVNLRKFPGGNGLVVGNLSISRDSTTFNVPSDGNIAPDEVVGTLPAGYWPPVTWSVSGGTGTASGFEASISSAGVVSLRSGPASAAIPTSATLRMSGCWPAA